MLKITIHDSPESQTFQVEGKLVGAWARELEQAWKTASSVHDRKARIVDLSGTLYIDEEGKKVLRKLFNDGAFFRTADCMTASIVDEVTGKSANPWRGILTSCLVLLLAVGAVNAAGPPPLKLTLREAVQMALKQNPQIQIANLNIAESQENQTIARSALLPQINLDVSESLHRVNLAAAFGKKIPQFPGHVGPFWLSQGGASGSMPIFDLTAWRRWQASKENVSVSRAQELTVREENVQLVVSQYLGSLRATDPSPRGSRYAFLPLSKSASSSVGTNPSPASLANASKHSADSTTASIASAKRPSSRGSCSARLTCARA